MKTTPTTLTAGAILAFTLGAPGAIQAQQSASGDIVETAVQAGSFDTLARALQAAGLVETLKGDGPFTVFAPTDEAFAALPEGTLESLLQDRERLTAVLTYHVVPGRVTSDEVVKLNRAETVQGQEVRIRTDADGVTVDGARVVQADVAASNGVIHVIDRVMLPGAGDTAGSGGAR